MTIMKKRFLSLFTALAIGVTMLSGCSKSETSNTETEELKQMIMELSNEVSELRGMLTLDPGELTVEEKSISNEDGTEIDRLIAEDEMVFLASPPSGNTTRVKSRDWSRYTSPMAKQRLTYAEATFYDRLDAVCKEYINDPTHGIVKSRESYTTKGVAYSDLGLEQFHAIMVFWWFKYNNPQYYFLKSVGPSDTHLYMYIHDFVMELDDQAKTTNEMFDKLDSWIAECCDDEITEWDKMCSINKKICEAVIYDPKVKAKVKGAAAGKNQSLYSVLMTPETVCTGYASAFGAMANALDIDTFIVLSNSHAWNTTLFDDGNYYFTDVCWNDESNGYNENFIGMGTDYAAYRDEGESAHIYDTNYANWTPEIPKDDYNGPDRTGGLAAPKLSVTGSGSDIVKVEWNAVDNAEKYEYTVSDGSSIIYKLTVKDTYAYVVLPDNANSVTVKVRAQGTKNGKTIYSALSEIPASVNHSGSKPAAPSNIKYKINGSNDLSLNWNNETQQSVLLCYNTDSTFKNLWFGFVCKNGVGWSNWNPENETYFSIAAIEENGSTESISDLVKFSYSKGGGLKLITESIGTESTDTESTAVDAPQNFHAWTQSNKKNMQCNWNAVSDADGYEIQVSYKSDFSDINSSDFCKAEKTAKAYVIPPNQSKIYFRIRTVKGNGDAQTYSDWVTAEYTVEKEQTPAPAKPAAPTGFKGEAIAEKKSTFTWNAVSGATGYNVALYLDAERKNFWVDYSMTETTLTLTPLAENATYYFGIRAVKSENGVDVYSDWTYVDYTQKYTAPADNGGDNGKVTKTYSNGDVYVGEMKDGKRNGQGTMTYKSGAVYVGNWKNDLWDGYGKFTWVGGTSYEGEYKNSKQDGHGKYIWTNGDVFECDFKDNKENGYGVYYNNNGDVFECEYRDGKPNGAGKYTWASGIYYECEYIDGKKNGIVTYTWLDGTTSTELWKDDKKIS